jgi:hypothetical protein
MINKKEWMECLFALWSEQLPKVNILPSMLSSLTRGEFSESDLSPAAPSLPSAVIADGAPSGLGAPLRRARQHHPSHQRHCGSTRSSFAPLISRPLPAPPHWLVVILQIQLHRLCHGLQWRRQDCWATTMSWSCTAALRHATSGSTTCNRDSPAYRGRAMPLLMRRRIRRSQQWWRGVSGGSSPRQREAHNSM